MTDGWNIAVLGATGAVGEALLELLYEREFHIGELHLLASERSVGETVIFDSKSYLVLDAESFDWSTVQLAFFVAGWEISARYAEIAAGAGCVVIDSSGIFAMESDVPLVVPDVNSQVLADYRNRNIISIANSLTSQLVTTIKPLINIAGLTRLHVVSMLSASSYGKEAVNDLAGQTSRLLNGLPVEPTFFQKQLAFNLLPLISDEKDSVPEERYMINQVRKILQDPYLPIVATCIRVPVFYGNAQIVHIEGNQVLSMSEAIDELAQCQNVIISDADEFPTPVEDANNNPDLSIGCMRQDYGSPDVLQFWSIADNVKFGGALMAIKTAELLVQEYMY